MMNYLRVVHLLLRRRAGSKAKAVEYAFYAGNNNQDDAAKKDSTKSSSGIQSFFISRNTIM